MCGKVRTCTVLSGIRAQKQGYLIMTTRNKVHLEAGLLMRHSLSESNNRNGKLDLFINLSETKYRL